VKRETTAEQACAGKKQQRLACAHTRSFRSKHRYLMSSGVEFQRRFFRQP